MELSDKNYLDDFSDGLPIKPDGRKWDWLPLQAVFPLLMSLALVAKAAATPAYPLRPSANHRYVVDSNNVPFLIIGDAPHSILAKLNNADATTYLTDRGNRGFNALWIELLCDDYTFGYGTEGETPNYGRDVNGNNPFTSTLAGSNYYDLTTPNEAYWSHVDFIVQTAAAHGLQCLFTPLDQGGWTQTSIANGVARCTQYGQFLGNRYKNSPNIIWNLGNDFQNWRDPLHEAPILAIVDGIRSADLNHLITTQLDFPASESQDDVNFIPRINTNGVYTYCPTYAECYVAYNKPTIMPVLFLEENYEGENNLCELGTPSILRRQEYWSLTAGALAGHMYGSYWIDRFDPAWQQHLSSQSVTELGYFKNFFTGIAFHTLVPDQNHALLTAGYGTYNGNCTSNDTCISGNDYATAARSSDGSLAVIYTPVAHTMTVAMGNFRGPVTARWFDPTNATFQTVGGSPFPNVGTHDFTTPGNNSAGDPDWVLLLQTATPTPTPTATPTATATPTTTPTPTASPTPTLTPVSTPAAPRALKGTNVTASSFTARWNGVSGAIGYRLDVSTSSSFGSYVPGYQNLDVGNSTSQSVTGLSANTKYYYRLRAYNGNRTSPNSNVITVRTKRR
jgi:uncharacterized protein DUF4038/collagenase-like protein with putative collagen-binding domain/fibronectin type III domain protein